MRLELEAASLKLEFPEYDFNVGRLGSWIKGGLIHGLPFWGSIFVTNSEGDQIGRILYKDMAYSHCKPYGAKGSPQDSFWERFQIWNKEE